MTPLVECVPNFSEGRRIDVVDAIVNAMTLVPHVYLLGREMDANHNRAVVTIVGSPETIGEAAIRGVETAHRSDDPSRRAPKSRRRRRDPVRSHSRSFPRRLRGDCKESWPRDCAP